MPDDNLREMPKPEKPDLSNSVSIQIGNKVYRITTSVAEGTVQKAEVVEMPEKPEPPR